MARVEKAEIITPRKAENTIRVVAPEYLADEAELKKLEARIAPLEKAARALKERMAEHRELIKAQFLGAGFEKLIVDGMLINRISGKPSVVVVDMNKIPKAFKKVVVEARKADIIAHWKETDKDVPGARVVLGDPSISITTETPKG